MKDEHKGMIIAGGLATAIISIVVGFGSQAGRIESCHSYVAKYVEAEYEEMSFDMEGDMDIDTWHESASPVYEVTTLNGKTFTKSHGFKAVRSNGGYWMPPMPMHDTTHKQRRHFHAWRDRHESNLTVVTDVMAGEEQDSFTESISLTNRCVENIGEVLLVNTWYGISYGADWQD